MLNKFSDFFRKKRASFVTLKKVTHLSFKSNLIRKYHKIMSSYKSFSFSTIITQLYNTKPIFSMHFSVCDAFRTSYAYQRMIANVLAAKRHFVKFNTRYLINN